MSTVFSVLLFDSKEIRAILMKESRASFSFVAQKTIDYAGLTEYGFVNPEDVFLKVERLVKGIEADCGCTVKKVYCALPTEFFRYRVAEKDLPVPEGVVTNKEVKAILDSCVTTIPGYVAVEKLPIYYKCFNNPYMTDPVGQLTDRLYVTASCGYLLSDVKELFDNCAKKIKKEFIVDSFALLAAKRLDYDYLKNVRRIVILFTEGHTEIALCEGAVPVDAKTIPWGESTVLTAITELLGCEKQQAEKLLSRINLNIAYNEDDQYHVEGETYSVKEVNSLAVEAVDYYAKEVKKMLSTLVKDDGVFFLTGSDFCLNRGVKELFEDQLGKDVFVATSSEPNLEGCANYVLSAYAIKYIPNDNKSEGLFQKIFNRRK